jgi:hypothetical protein
MKYNRTRDVIVEKLVAQKIDEYYKNRGIKFERIVDRKMQYAGVDLILYGKNDKKFNIDEKAKYHNLENGEILKNYSFEVNRLCRDGIRRLGWLVNKNSSTDIYCYAFPKFDEDGNIKEKMLVELFSKHEILNFIKNEISIETLIDISFDMADNDIRIHHFNNFILYKTPKNKLIEEPVNVLIKREILLNLKSYKSFLA